MFACRLHDFEGFFLALYTMHGALYIRIKILHTDAHAVKTELAQSGNILGIGGTRIDLNGIFTRRVKLHMIAQARHQIVDLVDQKEIRRATTPVHLPHLGVATQ